MHQSGIKKQVAIESQQYPHSKNNSPLIGDL